MILGAMQMHIPLIKYAKDRGYYVITVDYTTDAPGHKFSDEYSLLSTTDLVGVENLAKAKNVDIVMTFNSDPAAYTAAYVSERLGLNGNSAKSVKIMSNKDLFRRFLIDNNFNCPRFKVISSKDDLKNLEIKYPALVKPVDSSGSKGITKIYINKEVTQAYEKAISFSRCKKVIIEEYIDSEFNQLHGDAFILDNKVVGLFLGDHHFNDNINGLVPFSTTFPTKIPGNLLIKIKNEIERFINEIGFKFGGINVEIRVDNLSQDVYLIEVGARNGGNFTFDVIKKYSGFDFLKAIFDYYDGVEFKKERFLNKYASYIIVHSYKKGVLKGVELSENLKRYIYKRYKYLNVGDDVNEFTGSNCAIEVLLLKSDIDSLVNISRNYDDNIRIEDRKRVV